MRFARFMRGTAGRLLRIGAAVALILVGLLFVGGTAGIVMAVVGVVPLAAGTFNVCLFGALLGVGLRGDGAKARAA
ncbi:YgaP family membrane protein [Mycobacterium kyorinense]|uniref:Inner membrane protein YgaP-like transmembrane domain-containing protein n=1 Tax=Mycobacterium kyorinense TaxID=487514 RepID=A0A1X1YK61_9MYCO|nr:DUF2892 domain-containing protein [Mycobacterium kyorinense]ORW11415.1 hypothetical protein AWC14_19160 [Mycobacterium kyorinense]